MGELLKWEITQKMRDEWTTCKDQHNCGISSLYFLKLIDKDLATKINDRKKNISKEQLLKIIQNSGVNTKLTFKPIRQDDADIIKNMDKIRKDLDGGYATIIALCKTNECDNPYIVLFLSDGGIDYMVDTHTEITYNSEKGLSDFEVFTDPYTSMEFIYTQNNNNNNNNINNDKLDSLEKLQKQHKIKIENSQRKTLRKTHKLNSISTPELVHFICADSGTCMAFGIENDKIKKLFNNYIDFKYVSSLKRIGEVSANGFVTQLEYKRNNYKSHAILKSSVKYEADNLYYEYLVGKMFINTKTKIFPCFLETYGCYMYTSRRNWQSIKEIKRGTPTEKIDLTKLLYLNNNINEHNLRNSCESSLYFTILIENIKNAQTLSSNLLNTTFLTQDLASVLYQIYMPLSQLSTSFTHYDLHDENVLVYKPFGENSNKYITFHYHLSNKKIITFKSKYLVKIIDYGRSFFKDGNQNSKIIYEALCEEPKCNIEDVTGTCGDEVGYGYLNNPTEEYNITPIKQNMSHDLRLLKMILNKLKDNRESLKVKMQNINSLELKTFTQIYSILSNVIYTGNFGTAERTDSGLDSKIHNVSDAYTVIEGVVSSPDYKNMNNTNYNTLNGGDLHIYTNKPMKFIPDILNNKTKSLDKIKTKIKTKTKTLKNITL